MKHTHLILLALTLCLVSAKSKTKDEGPLIHEYIKLAFWLLAGVIVGVFFEAKMHPRDIIEPIVKKGASGLLIAFGIYSLFMFASLADKYL
jgi:hypothetical protein